MSIYNIGTCDYCEENNEIVRGTPFMADIPAKMCEHCWSETKKEYKKSNGEYISSFDSVEEEYKEIKNSKCSINHRDNNHIEKITLTYEDGTIKDIDKGAIISTGRIEDQEEIEMGMEFCNMSGDDVHILAQGIVQMLRVLGEYE